MTTSSTTMPVRMHCDDVASMLREIGLVLLSCDARGALELRRDERSDWLVDLLCTGLVREGLKRAVVAWTNQVHPAPVEVVPGLWFAPAPVQARRDRVGYAIAGIPTSELLDSEHLAAMCQATRMDLRVCQERLRRLGVPGSSEIPRLSALFARLWSDRQVRDGREQTLESLGRELAETWEEINLLYSITDKMTVEARPHRFAAQVCQELIRTLPYGWVAACIDRESTGEGRLIVCGDAPTDRSELRTLLTSLAARGYVDGPRMAGPVSGDDPELDALGTAGLAQPIGRGDRVIGMLVAGDKQGHDSTPSSVDIKLLGAAAALIGLHLENAGLFDDMNTMFLGTLEAITASIDAKDRYTCGHSRRVAMLTRRLAEAAGLDASTVHRMHIAGLVHDVGKIGVPEHVLCKTGKLTDDEFDLVRRHPDIGWGILKDIPNFEDILEGVRHHHERWDGQGYPCGLSGADIPLAARIIALADTFDAMCSSRTYRGAMARHVVLEEIEAGAGTQFDPELVPLFLGLDLGEWDRMVSEHRDNDSRLERAA